MLLFLCYKSFLFNFKKEETKTATPKEKKEEKHDGKSIS